jgi:AhpC/TSA family
MMLKLLSVCALAGLSTAICAAAIQGPPQGQPPAGQPPQAPPQYSADLKAGDMAPDFSLPGSDGKTHKLSDYRGKTIVLAWFPKAFTGG